MPVDRPLVRVNNGLPVREEETDENRNKGPWCARCQRKLYSKDVVVRNDAEIIRVSLAR